MATGGFLLFATAGECGGVAANAAIFCFTVKTESELFTSRSIVLHLGEEGSMGGLLAKDAGSVSVLVFLGLGTGG